jgi:hypothetical protein
MTLLRATIGLAALASLAAPAAHACDMHGDFYGPAWAYGSFREGELSEEAIRKAELEAERAREEAMANARQALLARFAIKADNPAGGSAPLAQTTQAGLDADRRTRTDPSYR